MGDFAAFVWVTIGVIAGVVLPVLFNQVRKEFHGVAGVTIPPWLWTYLKLLVFSVIAALACLAIWRASNPTTELHWFTAFLIGFGFESTLEKLFRPKP